MKRLLPILLLFLLLFNTLGYYILFIGLRQEANNRIEKKLDKGSYNINETIVLKAPVMLPYQPNWDNYERTSGEIFYQGKHYNAVKHRIYRDTMYTVYVCNNYKNHLYRKLNDLIESYINIPINTSKNAHVWDNLLKDYLPRISLNSLHPFFTYKKNKYPDFGMQLSDIYLKVLLPPPKIVA